MIISQIVAVAENWAIGKDNRLLWSLPSDMKFFKETTEGHCVITGRKNYESIPEKFRPLKNRNNIIVTRNKNYKAPGATVVHSITEAIEIAKSLQETECFIIGGAEIYKQSLPITNRIYLTKVAITPDADAYYPEVSNTEWNEIKLFENSGDGKENLSFKIYKLERKNKN